MKYIQDIQKHRQGFPSSLKLSNGYILPEGKMTPNTLFVGGIDMKVMALTIFVVLRVKTGAVQF